MVIVTNENKPIFVITPANTISYNIMNNYNIKSTTGAGDSFIGGFLSKYIINQDIDESISQGTYNASKSIENIGPLLSIESCIDKTTKSTLLPNNIIVIGNSCAGKTTFTDYFKKYYNIYSDIDDLEPLLEAFMLDDLLYQNKIEEFKKIKNEIKYVNKIWEEYNDNINSINHYTKPANLGNGHDIIRPILWDYIIQMAIVNPETHNIIQFSRGKDELYESQFSQNAYFRSIKNFIDNSYNESDDINGIDWFSSLNVSETLKDLLILRRKMFALTCCEVVDMDKYMKLDASFALPQIRFLTKNGEVYQMILSNNYEKHTKFLAPGSILVFDGTRIVEKAVQSYTIDKPSITIFKK